jgi:hypothetical protein
MSARSLIIPGLACLACSLLLPSSLPAASVVKLADHPTAKQTPFPTLHSTKAVGDRIYFGYGDWTTYPAVVLVSYTPARNVFTLEHSVASDSIEFMREIDGTLYIPHCDPAHYEDFHDFSYRGPDGRWLQSAAFEQEHAFDFVRSPDGIFCASNSLLRSVDQGRNWEIVGTGSLPSWPHFYWVCESGGTVFSSIGRFHNGSFVPDGQRAQFLNATPIRDEGTDLVIGLGGGFYENPPGIKRQSPLMELLAFDGSGFRMLWWNIRCFTVHDNTIYCLRGPTIYRCTNPAAAEPTFTALPLDDVPSTVTSLDRIGDRFYLGTTNGEIWVASADGSDVVVTPPAVEDRIHDQFGRGLAFSGEKLLVGAPNAAAPVTLSGRTEVWRHREGAWERESESIPPVPDFSGWYGRDVALHGDLAAIVEAGHDLSGKDRGANAKVHVQQFREGAWAQHSALAVPFAHSAAIQDDLLVVGTANPAADQQSGRPGVTPYAIVRDGAGAVTLNEQPQLVPTSTAYGYKALARVALLDDLLIAGFSGDPSRGATGLVSVYRKHNGAFDALPVQEIAVTTPQRYGFGLAAHTGWVAVGAPFEDTGARNAGAVYLYEVSAAASSDPPLVHRQTLAAPTPQPHAEFGAAVAMHGDLLLVGSPGREVNGVRQRGAVYRYRRQSSGHWAPVGELAPAAASETEFGIELAVGAGWQAAGSLGSTADATGLTSRVRLVPRSGFEEWLDTHLVAAPREALSDGDQDGLPLLLEYVFNLSPASADLPPATAAEPEPFGVPQFAPPSPMADGFLAYVQVKNDPRVSVAVEWSTDLVHWTKDTREAVVVDSRTTHELVRIPVPHAVGARWWRVKAIHQAD